MRVAKYLCRFRQKCRRRLLTELITKIKVTVQIPTMGFIFLAVVSVVTVAFLSLIK